MMNSRTLQSRMFRKRRPNYNKNYTKRWYEKHPGYHAKQMRDLRQRRREEKLMPIYNAISPEKAAAIRADLALGTMTQEEIGNKYKLHKSSISKVKRGIVGKASLPSPKSDQTALIAQIRGLRAEGLTILEIAAKLGINKSKVNYYVYPNKGEQGEKPHRIISVLGSRVKPLSPERAKFRARVLALKAQGLGPTAVARKLGVTTGSLSFIYYKYKKDEEQKSNVQGAEQNGHQPLDAKFLVGFGCAELERTLTAVAQRLGISASLLRSGFQRFLGSTSLRS